MATITSWSGNIADIGPIYPMVGTEFMLVIIGVIFWLGFHIMQARIEKGELEADEAAARSPERLKRVFDEEAHE